MQPWRLLFLAVVALPAWAAAPGWRETRDADLSGPAVTWVGVVESMLRDDAYTCFLLKGEHAFATCAPGRFDAAQYGPGQALRVKGSLGKARPRKIGEREFDGHFIAAPFVERTELLRWEPAPLWYDPFYYPYGYPYGYGPSWGMCAGRWWSRSGMMYCPYW